MKLLYNILSLSQKIKATILKISTLSILHSKFLIVLFFFLGGFQFTLYAQNCDPSPAPGSSFCASDSDNDAYIDVSWMIPANCFDAGGGETYEDGIFLQLKANGVVIHSETIYQDTPTQVNNTFRHEAGPDKTVQYQLFLYIVGPASQACPGFPNATMGTTMPYQALVITSITDGGAVELIRMHWTHTSKLASRYSIYRDGEVIAHLDAGQGTTYSYDDLFQFDDSTSIVNGEQYEYCIETFSDITGQVYSSVCANGKTYDINIQASDNTFEDKVEITWANIHPYWNKVNLYRDEDLIYSFANAVSPATQYTDVAPTYGKQAIYTLELLHDNVPAVEDSDAGSVPKNGKIAGKVLTLEDLFPVEGVKIVLEGTAGDTLVKDSVLSDFAGNFCFNAIYYEKVATFSLTAHADNKQFENNPQEVTLLSQRPTIEDIVFLQDEAYEIDENATLNLTDLQLSPQSTRDKLDISWTYTYNASTTTFFNLYRDNNLIASLNDAAGEINSFTDLQGDANTTYIYRLVAFQFNAQQQIIQTSLEANATFPAVAPPTAFNVAVNMMDGLATLSWNAHTSSNFEGFFIYRNGKRIVSLAPSATTYTDSLAAPGSSHNYSITAFRNVGDKTRESIHVEDGPTTMPALPAALNANAVAQAGKDRVDVSWEVPAALHNTYNYTGFAVYRKTTGSTDKQWIATKYKTFAPAGIVLTISDYTGKPEQEYTYEICTFLATPDTTYHANMVAATATFPAVTNPNALVDATLGTSIR